MTMKKNMMILAICGSIVALTTLTLSQYKSDESKLGGVKVSEKITDDMRQEYVRRLLAAGYQKHPGGYYIAHGLTIDEIKKAIVYSEPPGLAWDSIPSRAEYHKEHFTMPFISASYEHSTSDAFTNHVTKSIAVIYDEAVDPKVKGGPRPPGVKKMHPKIKSE